MRKNKEPYFMPTKEECQYYEAPEFCNIMEDFTLCFGQEKACECIDALNNMKAEGYKDEQNEWREEEKRIHD